MNTQAETRMIIFVLIKSGPKPNTCHCTFTQLWQIHTGLKSKGGIYPRRIHTVSSILFFFRFHIIPHNHQQDITLSNIYL